LLMWSEWTRSAQPTSLPPFPFPYSPPRVRPSIRLPVALCCCCHCCWLAVGGFGERRSEVKGHGTD
jgi:hypothetical protein